MASLKQTSEVTSGLNTGSFKFILICNANVGQNKYKQLVTQQVNIEQLDTIKNLNVKIVKAKVAAAQSRRSIKLFHATNSASSVMLRWSKSRAFFIFFFLTVFFLFVTVSGRVLFMLGQIVAFRFTMRLHFNTMQYKQSSKQPNTACSLLSQLCTIIRITQTNKTLKFQ